ncbi:hypothetical protein ABRZ08_13040 [Castellaniella ginsengisoli]|uniref:Uncharacterized protein n=1 Tax=Castellaniella ginsengisoli TaxID=546114 RepID=A0AB39G2F7_9BURK
MSKLVDLKTDIELATRTRPSRTVKEFEFDTGEKIAIDIPIKSFLEKDTTVGELHRKSIQRAIDLLSGLLAAKH